MQATDRFMGCRSLALCVEMYLFSKVTMALNSTGTVETKPSKRRDRSSCIIHFTSDCKGFTSWIGGASSASLVTGCLGKRRPSMTLKLSVWFWLLLPSSEIVSRLRIHPRSWWRWRCGMPVSLLIGRSLTIIRVGHSDFRMGGEWSPPIGGGLKRGDKGPMGGDWRVIRDTSMIWGYKWLKPVSKYNISLKLNPN